MSQRLTTVLIKQVQLRVICSTDGCSAEVTFPLGVVGDTNLATPTSRDGWWLEKDNEMCPACYHSVSSGWVRR